MQPKIGAFFLVFFLIFSVPSLFAQEDPDDYDPPQIDIDWITFDAAVYTRGDRIFNIGIGVFFPLFFYFADPITDGTQRGDNLSIGGTGTLAFNFFLNSNVFVGGELSGMFAPTRERNMLIMVPFGVRLGYQFLLYRFEFPVSLMVGAANQMLRDHRYFGPVAKPSAGAFWRFSQDWSFGANATWWFVPQRGFDSEDVRRDVFGNFLTVTFTARYHF